MIAFADLYCGAGGTTTGVLKAAKRKGIGIKSGVAINHWPVAVATHGANHPLVKHLCESIERVDPCEAVPGGRLDLLWASPECTHHSRARGGKPRQNQSRAGASHVLTWLDKLYVVNVIIENVPEFMDWGPLGADGHPLKSQKGESFRAFIESLKARNYNVEYRVLNAADFGDATTRKRLFIIARRRPLKIVWPEPTHRSSEELADELFGKKKKWRPARDIIDWSDLGTALSQRKRPLRPNTMRRIMAGLEKFCGLSFVMGQQSCAAARSTDDPIPTVATDGAIGVVQPFIVGAGGQAQAGKPRPTSKPLATVMCQDRRGLVTPFLIPLAFGGEEKRVHSVKKPLSTVTGSNNHYLVQPFLMQTDQTGSNGKCVNSVDEPLPTAVTKNNKALVSAFVLPREGVFKGNKARSVSQPLPTATASHGAGFLVSLAHQEGDTTRRTKSVDSPLPTIAGNRGEYALCRPYIVRIRGTEDSHINASASSTEEPLSTISTAGTHHLLVNPFITKYYGTATAVSVEEPLDSVTTKDRFLLVNPKTNEVNELEIYFRLLKPEELALAHSFPKNYKFTGNKTQVVKQIGNSNPVELTAALTAAVI